MIKFFLKGLPVIFALILFFAPSASANFWVDNWTNASYYTTNAEKTNFRSFLLRSEGRFGFQFSEDFSAIPYIVYYGSYSQDPNYWNNELAYGAGLRLKPFSSLSMDSWFGDFLKEVKIYGEILNLKFLQNASSAEANGVKTTDFRIGIDLWREWNLSTPNYSLFWGELWTNFSYRDTNFYDTVNFNKFQTYVAFQQLKVGRHFPGGIKPYVAIYVNKSGSSKAWLNNIIYGIGLRMEPFREQEATPVLLRKFKMFLEVLNVSLLAEQDPTRPTSDFRFGVECTEGR